MAALDLELFNYSLSLPFIYLIKLYLYPTYFFGEGCLLVYSIFPTGPIRIRSRTLFFITHYIHDCPTQLLPANKD